MELPNDVTQENGSIPGTPPIPGQAEVSHSETGPIPGIPSISSQAEVSHPVLIDVNYQKAMAPLKPQPASYWTSLVLTGSIVPLPIAAAIITATLYIASHDWTIAISFLTIKVLVIGMGICCTILFWLFCSWPFKRFSMFATANARSANHLKLHMLALKSALKLLWVDNSSNGEEIDKALQSFRAANPQDYDLALDTVCSCLVEANQQVESGSLSWIMGSGYIGVWNLVQRAEEAILAVAPRGYVLREALHDEASINGSTIADRASILSNTKTAMKVLSPSASVYSKPPSVQDLAVVPADNSTTNDVSAPTTVSLLPMIISSPPQNFVLDPSAELDARNALRDTRQTLNEFRTNLWEGIVTLRNQLVGTALITALLTYILFFVAMSSDVTVEAMKAAIVFYLVGAIVGLFSRLYTESQNDSAVDDYGLTVTRVVVTPLVSGLAALAGVLVIAVLSINVLNAPGTAGGVGLPQLANVYDLVQNRQGIIIAALFGLTPNLLMNILQQKADDAKVQLKNSSAPSQGNS